MERLRHLLSKSTSQLSVLFLTLKSKINRIMIITLSPAKMMNFESPIHSKTETKPKYEKQANEIMDILKNLDIDDLKKLMSINPTQAAEVYQYVHGFNKTKAPQRQSIFAYNGMAYLGLNAKTMTEEDLTFAQKHLVILSGLYGALQPFDMIKPYRLEMQAKLETVNGKDLYEYWKETLTKYLIQRLSKEGNIWVNLMSAEYTKAINFKQLPKDTQIVTPIFKEYTDKGYRQIVVYTKKARGLFARFIIENKIDDIDHLKGFDKEGYYFSPDLSNEKEWIFVR